MSLLMATPREKLLSLINTANVNLPVPATGDNLYFGRPKNNGTKTTLATVGMLASDYEGYVTFDYKRIDLTTAFGSITPEITSVGALTLYQMLDTVNKAFGTDFTEEDVEDVSVANVVAPGQTNIRVKAKVYSYGYTGEFIFKFTRIRPDMIDIIALISLDTLHHFKDPTDGLMSLTQAMWDFDFTPYKSTLELFIGSWRNIAAVRAMMVDYGFTTWPSTAFGVLTDTATSNVPYANPKYDRVILQPDVTIDGYKGTALFHYDNLLT